MTNAFNVFFFSFLGSSTRSKHDGGGVSIGDDDLYESIYEVIRAPSESDFEEIPMENEGSKHKVSFLTNSSCNHC